MNVPFFIARRYLFSKKSTNIINIISVVAIIGVAVGTMALISVLSIFNGLESLIVERFNTFNNDLRIEPVKGKTFEADSTFILQLKNTKGIESVVPVLEENVLIKYNDVYHPFPIKGVAPEFTHVINLRNHMIDGDYKLNYKGTPTALIGIAVSGMLSYYNSFMAPVQIYVPNPKASINDSPENAFLSESIMVSGIFSIDPEIDYTVIVPIDFLRQLLNFDKEVTAIEIQCNTSQSEEITEALLEKSLGSNFNVKNRNEQNELLFKIMKSEKLIVFLLLAFILLIASFNILGSLTMLIIEKKQDTAIIRSFGLGLSGVRKIFLYQGLMIAFLGAISGLILGILFCIAQQQFNLIPMEGANPGSFIVNSYPVEMRFWDIVIVFGTVLIIGYVAARFPVKYITRKYINENEYK